METISPPRPGTVAWVRDVNSRWIVHRGLNESTEAYLANLEATDQARLITACERAARLIHECGPDEDPKPWFYAGLFSVSTVEEAKKYLTGHWFTAECVPSLAGQLERGTAPEQIGPETEAKIARVRQAVSKLG